MIDYRQLRCFLATAEELHFAGAADRLHLAQSALSLHIRHLEERLGARLFHRSKRSAVTLTEAGRLFLPEAVAALRQIERAEQVGRAAGRGESGRVTLGYVGSAVTSGLLAELLRRFRHHHPAVRMEVIALDTPTQIEALGEGRIDIALIRPRPQYGGGNTGFVIQREPIRIALAVDHPLAATPRLRAADLAQEVFLIPHFHETAGFSDKLHALAEIGRFEVRPTDQVGDFLAAISLAAAGYGVVLGPRSLSSLRVDNIVFREIEDFDAEIELALAHRSRGMSPCVAQFVDSARTFLAASAQP